MKTDSNTTITPPPNAKTITTETVCCWIDENGIAIFLAHGIQTYEEAKKNMNAFRQLAIGEKTPILLEFTNVKTITREAREYYTANESSSLVLAIAIVTNSVMGKVIGNFFIGLNSNKAKAPVKLFTKADDAKRWLMQFLSIQQ